MENQKINGIEILRFLLDTETHQGNLIINSNVVSGLNNFPDDYAEELESLEEAITNLTNRIIKGVIENIKNE